MAVQRDKVIASAEKLVARGKIEPAIKEYERLLDENPNDVNTLNRIGDLWVRINRMDEAVKVFSKIADHYSRDGFFLKAIAIYKKINKLDPSKLDIYGRLADLYAKQGLAMEAKSQYQVLADYYLKHGDPGNALQIYRKISELDPNSINVHVKLADLYSQNNQTAEALKEYDRVGRMLLKRGMLDEAVQVFRKALKIDTSNVELVDSLVAALLEAKDYENATQIIETALETNPNDARLLATRGRIALARGDAGQARASLERALSGDPNNPAVREALADLHLRMSNPDKALEMLAPLVEKALSRGERGTAVEMLNRVLRVDSGHTPTLERLVATYMRLNEETNILASMNSLAEAHVAKGQFEQASKVLERLIEREPQNAQHRNKLQFVRSQMGAAPEVARIRPKSGEFPAVTAPPPAPTSPPMFELDLQPAEEEPSLTIDLDASEPIDLDLDLSAIPAPPPPVAPPPPPPPPPARLTMPEIAAEEQPDDLDFITEHLTEAEVFAKYGLTEKAAEHLRAVIERSPKHVGAHEKLYRILLDDGEIEAARTVATSYVSLLTDEDAIAAVGREFTSRGYTFAAPPRARKPTVEAPAPPRAATAEEPLLAAEFAGETELSFDLDTGGVADLDFGSITFDTTPPAPVETASEPEAVTFEPEPPPPESFFSPGPTVGYEDQPAIEEIGEIDFYIEQELFDEARTKLDALLVRYPGNGELQRRRERLDEAAAAAPPPAPAPPPFIAPPTLSRDEIESELLSALPDDEEEEFGFTPTTHPPIPAPPVSPPPVPLPAEVHEDNLFADEDNFFDLAAELESELEPDEEEPLALSEEEQSLEEIFREFKKGVEQQLDSEDYDTHYNLGIAYKEMGLIDEAIGEFQLASKDPKRAVECASMLGLCFLEKGMPQLAIKWYRKGLEMPEITEEEHIGLLYDLGSAYMEVGDTDNAQKAFMEVYGMNTNYRDVVSRIKQLEDARK
jgi:tetratricopeptide (TPR) repeat protein